MKSLLRVLGLRIFAFYLFSHYGSFLRRNGWPIHSNIGREVLNHPPQQTRSHLQAELPEGDLPPGALPRHDLTPGAIDPGVTQRNIRNTICRRGYTVTVRPPFEYTNAMKHRLMRRYGVTGSIHDYELDHLIPLELGGCPKCETNLWPEPRNVFPSAGEKDEVESYLHDEVCSGAMPLAEAQQQIATDWYAVYKRIHSKQ